MRLVCLSDTHGMHDALAPLPAGDVLVHAGDCTRVGAVQEVQQFLAWFAAQPHRHKVLVAGNHDWLFERSPGYALSMVPPGVTYLQDAACVIDGVLFWGSPWSPRYFNWAFNLDRDSWQLEAVWQAIPPTTQVLITHTPAHGLRDDGRGCERLRQHLVRLPYLRAHVFGHVHVGYGIDEVAGVAHVNAATCTIDYEPTNPPLVIDL